MNDLALPPWAKLMKQLVLQQLGPLTDKKILDFRSGQGATANFLAATNDVVAVEPDQASVDARFAEHDYVQLVGSLDQLQTFSDDTFDVIICHNVLEYVPDQQAVVAELARLLKVNGTLSIVKHHRAGRVMQMVVLLDNFEHANQLLDGQNSVASKFGAINYYDDDALTKWAPELLSKQMFGLRTFWDLQQDQTLHADKAWQDKMLAIEMRVSTLPDYQSIAFFHHLLLTKNFSRRV